jgi:two-component system cell cycle response regulator DivK
MGVTRVLLVHENADCRGICRAILEFDGCEVVDTWDGDDAIMLLAKQHFDLVATDLYVRSVDDECLLARIKRTEWSSHLPVVVVTGWTTDGHRRVATRERADAFLTLPVTPHSFLDAVHSLLPTTPGRASSFPGPAPHSETGPAPTLGM